MRLKFTPLEFETEVHFEDDATTPPLKFTPLEFETLGAVQAINPLP